MSLTIAMFSQSTEPRWSIAAGGDLTSRSETYKKISKTDATGADTVKVYPTSSFTHVHATINDSLVFNITPLTGSYQGDEITFSFLNTSGSGHKVEFLTTNVELATAGKLTLSSAKRAIIRFYFTGVKWLEMWRDVQ